MFFFKQKTAYEMRISDWSSDVCSSDLSAASPPPFEEPAVDQRDAWPEARQAMATGRVADALRRAPDRTPMVNAADALAEPQGSVLLMTTSASEVTRVFRAVRFSSAETGRASRRQRV